MSEQPKEWTHEKLQGLLQISNEDRYVVNDAFENTLDEINAELAAAYKKGFEDGDYHGHIDARD